MRRLAKDLGLAALALQAFSALADPEIMVHEKDLSAAGEVTATLHFNHVLRGARTTADGTWPAHRLTNAMAEFATGIAPGWEAGIHLPAMRAGLDSPSSRRGEWGSSAVMVRVKHITEWESGWFIGFNAEYDINARRYVPEGRGVEFRGIAGVETQNWRFVLNPHLIWGWGAPGSDRRPDFNVDFKAVRKLGPDFAWGAEIYSDWGKTNELRPGRGDRTVYLVAEFDTPLGALHLGIGKGFKATPEDRLVKLVWSGSF